MQDSKHDNIIVLNFDDSKIPEFKELRGKAYTYFGEDNAYPDYLTKLYNKSAKHSAIINGKLTYIFGEGFYAKVEDATTEKFLFKINSAGESLNDIAKKCALDIEIYGGFYLNIIPNKLGQICDIYHLDFGRVRANEDCSQFFYRNDWTNQKDKIKEFPAFDENTMNCPSIFFYKEYRPGLRTYCLPNYLACMNFIEADMEVSKHTLTNAKTGFSASKMINFFNGEPAPEMQRDIHKRLEKKFTGSDGSKIVVTFNNDPAKAPTILDLGSSDLTKEDFQKVDALITANLMSGHQITSPTLFGIQEPGKLGTRNELKMAYDIFNNTYVSFKQRTLEKVFNFLAKCKGIENELFIRSVDPVGIEFTDASLLAAAPKSWLLEKMGIDVTKYNDATLAGVSTTIPDSDVKSQAQITSDAINSLSPLVANKVLESMTADEIRALAGLTPNPLVKTPIEQSTASNPTPIANTNMNDESLSNSVNSVLTNLTGRQHQQISRIVRQYTQGKLSLQQASLMLKSGFGFSDADVNSYLGVGESQFSAEYSEVEVANMLLEGGQMEHDFTIVSSKEVNFTSDEDMRKYEEAFFKKEAFDLTKPLTYTEKEALKLISKDSKITSEVVAKALKIPVSDANDVLTSLETKGAIKAAEINNLGSITVERTLTDSLPALISAGVKIKLPEIKILYSYDWKSIVPTSQRNTTKHPSRPFCKMMMSKPRLFSRTQIETLSQTLGYSLWDRTGGFWNMGNGQISASCRHQWKSNIVVKKA